ncbi:MAG: class I SAM-dependent methyltransferase [Gammaproteobacteria bacterium]|nr:class I SAM-dependent methyltransferase [Gammaproteobacteria bacterium]
MSLYDRYILSPMIDRMCGTREVMDLRAEVVPEAEGQVLELGLGSGLNLGLYDPEKVRRVTGVDPGENITALARERIAAVPFEVEMLGLSGESVPADDHSFDSVVVTFTFCTIPDVHRALGEVRRLLKPGGRLLFAEHGLSPDPAIAALAEPDQPDLEGPGRRLSHQPGHQPSARGRRLRPRIRRAPESCHGRTEDRHLGHPGSGPGPVRSAAGAMTACAGPCDDPVPAALPRVADSFPQTRRITDGFRPFTDAAHQQRLRGRRPDSGPSYRRGRGPVPGTELERCTGGDPVLRRHLP